MADFKNGVPVVPFFNDVVQVHSHTDVDSMPTVNTETNVNKIPDIKVVKQPDVEGHVNADVKSMPKVETDVTVKSTPDVEGHVNADVKSMPKVETDVTAIPDITVKSTPDVEGHVNADVKTIPDVVVKSTPDVVVKTMPKVETDVTVKSTPDVEGHVNADVKTIPDVVVKSTPDVVVKTMPKVETDVTAIPDVTVKSTPDVEGHVNADVKTIPDVAIKQNTEATPRYQSIVKVPDLMTDIGSMPTVDVQSTTEKPIHNVIDSIPNLKIGGDDSNVIPIHVTIDDDVQYLSMSDFYHNVMAKPQGSRPEHCGFFIIKNPDYATLPTSYINVFFITVANQSNDILNFTIFNRPLSSVTGGTKGTNKFYALLVHNFAVSFNVSKETLSKTIIMHNNVIRFKYVGTTDSFPSESDNITPTVTMYSDDIMCSLDNFKIIDLGEL